MMVRRIMVACDVHALKGEDVDAATVRISIDGDPRELDLCVECREQYVEPLRALLVDDGKPVREQALDGTLTCTLCGKAGYVTQTKLTSHRRKIHGLDSTGRLAAGVLPSAGYPIETLVASAANGKRQGTPPAPGKTRSLPCLLCPLTYAADSGLRLHYQTKHRLIESSFSAVYGDRCPLCGVGNFSMLGQHVKRDHSALVDPPTTPVAFKVAEDAGDEYGVVKAVRERLLV